MTTAIRTPSIGELRELILDSVSYKPEGRGLSLAEGLSLLDAEEREILFDGWTESEIEALMDDWGFWARPKQIAPDGAWSVWSVRAGRGFGKTRTGAMWVHERAMEEPRWIAIIAKTPADARDYMIEGPGGILKNVPKYERPLYEPSKRRLTWSNGSWATVFSSEEADQLRGFSGDTAWLDEFAKYKNPDEVWENLDFGMREISSDRPRRIITTTPRPIKILKDIEEKETTVTVRGRSYENKANLASEWIEETLRPYEGTRTGRQEINAEILEDVEGALWSLNVLDETRWPTNKQTPKMTTLAIAVDPNETDKKTSDECGIMLGGVGMCSCLGKEEPHGFLIDDLTIARGPEIWSNEVVTAAKLQEVDMVIGEVNSGGDMVELVIRAIDKKVAALFEDVRASRGKRTRAEPVANYQHAGKIHLVGSFPLLEDELTTWIPNAGKPSPNRLDAYVWLFTKLLFGDEKPGLLWGLS